MDRRSFLKASSIALGAAAVRLPAPADDAAAALARAPRPWDAAMYHFTREEYEETLRYWAEAFPHFASLQVRGRTAEGEPIWLLRVTDGSVEDGDKQVCLVASLHGGPERSGTTTIMHLAGWLLGDSAEAAEVRRKQVLLLMPIVNPYAFFTTDRFGNSQGVDPYTGAQGALFDPRTGDLAHPERSPEVAAFVGVVDEYRPDVFADMHGIGLQEYPASALGDRHLYFGQTMFESSGAGYSNLALRPWDWRVTEVMVAAARRAGYGSDRYEADAQRAFDGPAMAPAGGRTWNGGASFYTALYAYARHHTMVLAMEIGWEESGLARLRGLLGIGNHVWEGEPVAGYPVDRILSLCGHFVAAHGASAADRRASRVELWQRQAEFAQAMLYPQTDCRDSYIVALGAEAAGALDPDPKRFLANLRGRAGFDVDAIAAFVAAGPEVKLYSEGSSRAPARPGPLQHGIALRLRVPYRRPRLVDLRLNGHRLRRGVDGCRAWYADGFTQVQVDVPPERARSTDLYVLTCAYDPGVGRTTGWRPPDAVRERLARRAGA